jgi:hypothetical protein
MKRNRIRFVFHAALALSLASIAGLWAWNTLAGLFGGPSAGFVHALAALVLLAIVRAAFTGRRRHRALQGNSHDRAIG